MIGCVKMKNINKVILLMIALLIILLSSGCQNKTSEKIDGIISDVNGDEIPGEEDENNNKEGELHSDAISYIMHSSEEIYLEYLGGSSILIFLPPENRSEILEFFKTVKINEEKNDDRSEEDNDNESYDGSSKEENFALHIKNKSINLYIGDEYFVLDDDKGFSKYYLEEDQIKKLNQLMTKIYLERANDYIHSLDSKEIQITAVDISQNILFKEKKKTDEIIKAIELTELIPKKDLEDAFIEYPYYKMDMKSDLKEMSIVIVERNVLRTELLGEVSYFKTKNDMVKLTNKYLVVEKPTDIFQRIFTANKLRVEMPDNQVMDYSDASHITQIARSLNGKIKENNRPASLFQTKKIKLTFYTGDRVDIIEVYDNYIIDGKDVYYKMLISEEILNIIKK